MAVCCMLGSTGMQTLLIIMDRVMLGKRKMLKVNCSTAVSSAEQNYHFFWNVSFSLSTEAIIILQLTFSSASLLLAGQQLIRLL